MCIFEAHWSRVKFSNKIKCPKLFNTSNRVTLADPSQVSEQCKMETLNKDKGGDGSSNLDNTVHFYFLLQNFGSQNENRCAFPVTEDCETYPSFSLALLRETNKICKPLRHITDA